MRQWSDDVIFFAHSYVPTDSEREALDARGITVVEGEISRLLVERDRLTGVELADGRTFGRTPSLSVHATPRMRMASWQGLVASWMKADSLWWTPRVEPAPPGCGWREMPSIHAL